MRKSTTAKIAAGVLSVAAIVAVGVGTLALHGAPTSQAAARVQQKTAQSLASRGTATLPAATARAAAATRTPQSGILGDTLDQALPQDDDRDQHTNAVYPDAPTTNPSPSGNHVTTDKAAGFQGLNHYDQRTRDGGNAFSLEPPDQGLCVGNGYVVEAVNDVMVVFDKSGNRLTTPTSLNTFFGLPYAIDRSTGVRGDFLSDPKCLWDAETHRFFLTVLQEDPAPSVRTHTLIAVSKTSDPRGAWYLYSIDTTDDGQNGTPANPGCPCLGDQPLIGANDDGFFISTNEFGAGFNGAQVYAMAKDPLTHGLLPKVVHINAGTIPTPDVGGIWYSIQPATAPLLWDKVGAGRNTEFFLSALQFGPAPLDNRVAVWAMRNTNALLGSHPEDVSLLHTVIKSETYGQPPNAAQKAGDYPLGQFLGEPQNQLAGNDDRMNQVVYSAGVLWSGVNTVIGDGSRVGIAWFAVIPYFDHNNLKATMAKQGYVSVAGNNVLFPSIGVNAFGKGAMTFTVVGPNYYPSAGYVKIDLFHGAGDVHLAGKGVGPADGFTGYPEYGGDGVERWGDYSAAVADADGTIWFATEYIAQSCTEAEWQADSTCGGTRTQLANWSTFVGHVRP